MSNQHIGGGVIVPPGSVHVGWRWKTQFADEWSTAYSIAKPVLGFTPNYAAKVQWEPLFAPTTITEVVDVEGQSNALQTAREAFLNVWFNARSSDADWRSAMSYDVTILVENEFTIAFNAALQTLTNAEMSDVQKQLIHQQVVSTVWKKAVEEYAVQRAGLMTEIKELREKLDDAEDVKSRLKAEKGTLIETLKPYAKAGELFKVKHDTINETVYAPAAGNEFGITGDDLRLAKDVYDQFIKTGVIKPLSKRKLYLAWIERPFGFRAETSLAVYEIYRHGREWKLSGLKSMISNSFTSLETAQEAAEVDFNERRCFI